MWHIWTLDDWEKNIDLERSGHRCGLRLRFDKEVDSEVRKKRIFFPDSSGHICKGT